MLRFSGSTAGTAWVALTYPTVGMFVLFAGCSAVAALGLAMSFYGENPALGIDAPPASSLARGGAC